MKKKQSLTDTNNITQMNPTTGVVLIATSSTYYIRAAFNLCLSLKAQNRDLKITLITDNTIDHLYDIQKFWFDNVIKVDATNAFQLKLSIYDLSPYDNTLYLDVDSIWNPAKSLSELLDSLSDIPFTMANRGYVQEDYDWCSLESFEKETGVANILNLSSEFIWFKKSDENKEMFKVAEAFYLKNNCVTKRIGSHQPDEPSFAFALATTKVHPHKVPYYPSFWMSNTQGKFISDKTIQEDYNLVSMGGNYQDKKIVDLYKRYALIAGEKLGVQPLNYEQKRTAVKHRQTI